MKRGFLLVITMAVLAVSCGGQLSLNVQPPTASASTNYQTNTYQPVVLTAILSNGQTPIGLQWKSSDECVDVGNNVENIATVVCSFTCGAGTATATITATAQGLTGHSTVTCTWQ
jgi:hypothetical protein